MDYSMIVLGVSPWGEKEMLCGFPALSAGNPARCVRKAVQLVYASLVVFVQGSGEGSSPRPFLKVSV